MSAFSSSGFSTSAFSTNAFDFGSISPSPAPAPSPGVVLLGGGPGYERPYRGYVSAEQRRNEYESALERRLELQRIEDELAEAERQRLAAQKRAAAALLAENAAIRVAALEAALQGEINRLRMERDWLIRRLDEEEATIALLMSLPLH